MANKCVNCGENMQPYYARDGSTMFICPNVRITIKKQGLVPYGFNFCSIQKENFNPVLDMLIEENKLSPLLVDSKESAELYAKSLTLKESFEKLAKNIILDQLRAATQNTISDVKLLESANLALVLGLDEQQLPERARDTPLT